MLKRQHWIQMVVDCAEAYKDKLTVEELLDILAVGSASGDGRLDHNEIENAVKKVYGKS